MENLRCRSCGSTHLQPVIDLGTQPLANNLPEVGDLAKPEPAFHLALQVCTECWLMQIAQTVPPQTLFSDYVYFSSFSDQMLRHAASAVDRYIEEKRLGADSLVVEVASNDGYLLKNFVREKVPCVGFEPAANVAAVARKLGVETRCEFFGEGTARALQEERGQADLILCNNVFAHAPECNDFVAGLRAILKPDGWVVLEFPYGMDMIEKVEFDTIYHEHVFYYTITPLLPLFARHGLEIFHLEKLPIHGGSVRVFVSHRGQEPVRPSVAEFLQKEQDCGVGGMPYYAQFTDRAEKVKTDLIAFFQEQRAAGKRVAAYGASAKGSTLLNFVGPDAADLEFIADRNVYKHGRLSPGLHIPITASEELAARAPDFALLLVWNFAEEVMAQQEAYRAGGGKFVIPLPELRVV